MGSCFIRSGTHQSPQITYSGCQKNVPIFERFFLQPLMPRFLNSEQNYEKRYKKDSIDAPKGDSPILGLQPALFQNNNSLINRKNSTILRLINCFHIVYDRFWQYEWQSNRLAGKRRTYERNQL